MAPLRYHGRMPKVSRQLEIPDHEIELSAVRSSGPGGQNVNKVASAIHLRFDVRASSLPDVIKTRLLKLRDRRINRDGIVVIKAQRFREQEKNRSDALERLAAFIRKGMQRPKKRIATKPSARAKRKRVDEKKQRGRVKQLRGPVSRQD